MINVIIAATFALMLCALFATLVCSFGFPWWADALTGFVFGRLVAGPAAVWLYEMLDS